VVRGINRGELLQGSHSPEQQHRPLTSSVRKVGILGSVVDGDGTTLVVTNAGLLAIGIAPLANIHQHADEAPSSNQRSSRTGTKHFWFCPVLVPVSLVQCSL
jgi:hypothetical protein